MIYRTTGTEGGKTMKHRAFALVLALCLVLAMVPAAVFAADVHQAPAPALSPAALPELEIRPLAATYKITMTSTGPGKAELYADAAGALESVYFLADPEPGYQVSFAKCGYYKEHHDMRLLYIGDNIYEIIMPDGDVILDLEFVAIPSSRHDVTLTVTEGGTALVDQSKAKAGESLFVDVTPTPGYSLESVRAKSDAGWLEGYYLGQNGDADRYEIFMPDADVEIFVTFRRNGPYDIETIIDSGMGTLEVSHESAYELDTVTVTSIPDRGYELLSIGGFHSQLTRINKTQWTFSMPKFKEEIHASFGAIDYALSVCVEEPQGGIAFLDAETGNIGQTVTLTCIPDDGYRIARITGAELTPGEIENTWTFVMDAGDVALSVLFLRENNPFLDVTELDFYHDPVLWAVENSITNGVDAEHFGPFTACNRAQVVTFLWRAAGSPEPATTKNPFTDVTEKDFFY